MENRIEITKASLKKDGKIKVSFMESGPEDQSKVGKEGGAFPHPDLVAAFKSLGPHLAAICEQRDSDGKVSDKVSCRSFVLSGEDENAGVLLSGVRKVIGEKVIALNSPFVFWEKDKNNYSGMKELRGAIAHCKDELYLYLDGKHGPNPQGDLFAAAPEEEKEPDDKQVKIPETPENVINEIVAKAGIEAGMRVCVPCARTGKIVEAILTSDAGIRVNCFDLVDHKKLSKAQMKQIDLSDDKFLKHKPAEKYDRILSQVYPRQDHNYVYQMHDLLAQGGRMVAVVLYSAVLGSGKKNDTFKQWLDKVNAAKIELPNGAFNESDEPVKTVMIIIDKP